MKHKETHRKKLGGIINRSICEKILLIIWIAYYTIHDCILDTQEVWVTYKLFCVEGFYRFATGLYGWSGPLFFRLLCWLEFDLLLQQLKQEKKPERDFAFWVADYIYEFWCFIVPGWFLPLLATSTAATCWSSDRSGNERFMAAVPPLLEGVRGSVLRFSDCACCICNPATVSPAAVIRVFSRPWSLFIALSSSKPAGGSLD